MSFDGADNQSFEPTETPRRRGPGRPRRDDNGDDGSPPRRRRPIEDNDPADPRPLVRTRVGLVHEAATEAEDILIAADAPFYVRGGLLMKPVVEEVEASRQRRTRVARLAVVETGCLIDYFSRTARWARWDERLADGGGWMQIDPPTKLAQIMLARNHEWRMRVLVGIITTPTLRPDGTILDRPGYDPITRLLLLEPPPMPPIPDRPTKVQAEEALNLLRGLLVDFPFAGGASRSVALSAIITSVVRGACPVVPIHVISAPTPGSGKSYLIDIVAAIQIGQPCPVIAAGRTEEETEKRLGAALLAGQPIISIDNLNGDLMGDALCQIIERPVVQVRVLGRSELARIETRATVFATGNNIQPSGDMVRRSVLCGLDTGVERPEMRQFAGDPVETVLTDRGRYIAACLTVVRAYIAAGMPDRLPRLASFGEWSDLVRSSLVWLGCVDPVDTMETARESDPETAMIRNIIVGWKQAIGIGVARTATEIITAATSRDWTGGESGEYADQARPADLRYPEFREALMAVAGDGREISSVRLGRWLGRKRGRVIDGLRIEQTFDANKQSKWILVR